MVPCRAAADLAKQVKALTFDNAKLKEDLAFFQSVMSPPGARDGAISVSRFRLQPEAAKLPDFFVRASGQVVPRVERDERYQLADHGRPASYFNAAVLLAPWGDDAAFFALVDEIEARWQRYWDEHGTFAAINPGQPGFDPTCAAIHRSCFGVPRPTQTMSGRERLIIPTAAASSSSTCRPPATSQCPRCGPAPPGRGRRTTSGSTSCGCTASPCWRSWRS